MESDLQHHPQTGSGLMRYQSAPSSYFSSFLDADDFFPRRPLSPETEGIFARFMNSNGGGDGNILADFPSNSPPPPLPPPPPPPEAEVVNQQQQQQQMMGLIKTETIHQHQPSNFYQSASQPLRPNQSSAAAATPPPMDFRVVNTAGLPPMKMEAGIGGGNNSNLIRQRSSPAGLFSNINIQNELASYAAMRGMGNVGAGFGGSNNEAQFSTGSSGLRTIAESGVKAMGGATSPESGGGFNEGHNENYVTGFPIGSWDDSVVMSNKVSGLKRVRDDDGTEAQSGREVGSGRPPLLTHHLSLQKTSAEMAAIDSFFQYQDSIPCKIRAKRGCATHPRSIAERVRRTRISERMRKLQELVPNMDKQTNTSDMLDLAVDYIKDLQKEVQKLSDIRSKCVCPHKKQQS